MLSDVACGELRLPRSAIADTKLSGEQTLGGVGGRGTSELELHVTELFSLENEPSREPHSTTELEEGAETGCCDLPYISEGSILV